MRFTLLILALLVPASIHAQEPVETPDLSAEQSWGRAVSNLNALATALIHQGREHGESAAEVGTRMGTLFGPSWSSEPGTGTPQQLVRGMAANLQSWPDADVAISAADHGAYELRYNRPWKQWFGDDEMANGASLAEYEAMWNAGVIAIADYLGLTADFRREGDRWVMTVRDADAM